MPIDHDDDPTPVRPGPSSGSGIRLRLHTPADGRPITTDHVAVVLEPHRTRARSRSDSDEQQAIDPLDERIDARIEAHGARRLRRLRQWLATVAGGTLIALGAAAKSMLTDAGTQGAEKLRIQVIERDLERSRVDSERMRSEFESFRGVIYRSPRRDDPPITSASKRTP